MRQNRLVRIVKRDRTERLAESAAGEAGAAGAETSERELRTVVSGWVNEHRRRSEEFRQNYANVLRCAGFQPPRAASRA